MNFESLFKIFVSVSLLLCISPMIISDKTASLCINAVCVCFLLGTVLNAAAGITTFKFKGNNSDETEIYEDLTRSYVEIEKSCDIKLSQEISTEIQKYLHSEWNISVYVQSEVKNGNLLFVKTDKSIPDEAAKAIRLIYGAEKIISGGEYRE